VFTERTSVGLDVHARAVAAAATDGVTGELFQSRLTPSHDHLICWLAGWPEAEWERTTNALVESGTQVVCWALCARGGQVAALFQLGAGWRAAPVPDACHEQRDSSIVEAVR
jgi:hypothetical protein